MLDLEEAYEELWPVVQNTDGVNRISIDPDWGEDAVKITIGPEGLEYGYKPIIASAKWTTKTSTLIGKLKKIFAPSLRDGPEKQRGWLVALKKMLRE